MAKIGYARVSTRGQSDDSQVDDLEREGCVKIFTDHGVTGKLAKRPELDKALEYLRDCEVAGCEHDPAEADFALRHDTLVITRLSRAMRSLRHMLELAAQLRERGIALKVLKQGIDSSTSAGRLHFHVLAAIDEFQREIIVEGTHEGLAAARARGRKGGRKPVLSDAQARIAREMYDQTGDDGKRAHTVAEIAAVLRCSRPTVYRYLDLGSANTSTRA